MERKERERERCSSHWFIPQMPEKLGLGQMETRNKELHSGLACGSRGTSYFSRHVLPPWDTSRRDISSDTKWWPNTPSHDTHNKLLVFKRWLLLKLLFQLGNNLNLINTWQITLKSYLVFLKIGFNIFTKFYWDVEQIISKMKYNTIKYT